MSYNRLLHEIQYLFCVHFTEMTIGKNYYEGYIKGKDKGIYLEYHDTGHFHMPLNEQCSGFLLLGKKMAYCKRTYEHQIYLTGFEIPYGYAIYTPPNTIHCDLFLTGKYKVAYTMTNNYSTAIIKNKETKKNVYLI